MGVKYRWKSRQGDLTDKVFEMDGSPLIAADCWYDSEEDANEAYERWLESGYLDEIEGTAMYDSKGRKIKEGTALETDQVGFSDYM